MTPSLSQGRQYPVRQDLCVSCIAAKAAAALSSKEFSTSDEEQDSNNQVLSVNNSQVHNSDDK